MEGLKHLKDYIDIEMFQKIQDDIAAATGLGIITCDYKGRPVTKHSKCAEFCEAIRKIKGYKELCEKCDSRGGLEAVRTGNPYIYRCHKGLVDFAVPIIIEDQYLGAVMAGQILTEEKELEKLEIMVQNVGNLELKNELLTLYNKIPVIQFEKIEAIAQMMFHISNYIVGEAALKMAQMELNEKSIKFIEYEKTQVELEKELKASQLKTLQSQVNPHFLFNILNTISSLALMENAPKTREVVCDLSDMLRYTLKKVDQIVTFQDEIRYSTSYLTLQKIRFGDRLDFSFDIGEGCKKIKIPFMILQPFIENSVIHGLELKENGGTVKVIAWETKENLVINIIDNGLGIPPYKLKDINKVMEYKEIEGIGINNVRQRMRYYYGDNYSIDIKSRINSGTEVSIILPKHL
ncbi:sensor histidine kinase [Clostridium rectalis]|uniref:sensor histidine kinase n=1 Tax=Clostridium rectalis TaxID=2040295 RepID=UPI000F641685|nr:PocR ligand-binding domain-containing protein [Clostridium rectalis]